MRDFLSKILLILSWALLIGLFIHSFSVYSSSFKDSLAFIFSFYTLSLGSFFLLKQPEERTMHAFFYFTITLASFFLFLPTTITFLSSVSFVFSFPFFYLFLKQLIQTKEIKNWKLFSLFFIVAFSLLLFWRFPSSSIPLFFLLGSTWGLSFFMLKKEKNLFFDTATYFLLQRIIAAIFSLLALSIIVPPAFFYLQLFSLALWPTCFAYFLFKEQAQVFSNLLIKGGLLFLASFLSALLSTLLTHSMDFFLVTFLQLFFTSGLLLFLVEIGQELRMKQLIKQQRTFHNEKLELLNQVTYADFFQQASALLSTRLNEITQSEHFLLLVEKQGKFLTLCQKGQLEKETILKIIPDLSLTSQAFTLQEKSLQSLRIRQARGTFWFFFEARSQTAATHEIIAFIEQYMVILNTVQRLHESQKRDIEAPLQTDTLLQEKLFNSIEDEKRQQANYLHDDILQQVIALQTLSTLLEGEEEIKSLLTIEFSKLIASIRRQIFDTTPSTLYHLSFEENSLILMEDFDQRYPKTTFLFTYEGDKKIPQAIVAPAYRMIKELNENIGKHAQATLATTTVQVTKEQLQLLVTDDGIGMTDFVTLEKELIHKKGHIGLLSIKNDVNWLNGTFRLLPVKEWTRGTAIQITIPIIESEDGNENTFSR